jgi:pimeloyl-ACP methyl ester carboxylesterase
MLYRFSLMLLAGICAGCASLRPDVTVPQPAAEQHCIVFVADGAGNFCQASKSIGAAIHNLKVPIDLETFPWSHGTNRVLADQFDEKYARRLGERLAKLVLDTRRVYPTHCICLLGHSAGCLVVLNAADQLPPGTVQRLILLNPSCHDDFDLRPALKAACDGIDVHCSTGDQCYLGKVLGFFQRFFGKPGNAAGIAGFNPVSDNPEDKILYTRLHNFPWNPDLQATTGNDGGHFGGYQEGYLRQFVLPRVLSCEALNREP